MNIEEEAPLPYDVRKLSACFKSIEAITQIPPDIRKVIGNGQIDYLGL